jgi:hypothetical protein
MPGYAINFTSEEAAKIRHIAEMNDFRFPGQWIKWLVLKEVDAWEHIIQQSLRETGA